MAGAVNTGWKAIPAVHFQDMAQIRFRIHTVQLAGADQPVQQ